MQQDPLEGLKKHYRSAWKGTLAGLLFILLLVLFAGEVNFSERFVGPNYLRKVTFNLAAALCFLVFLVLNGRKTAQTIDLIRQPLIVGAVSYFLVFWLLGFTNRIGREALPYIYNRDYKVESMGLKSIKDEETGIASPAYWLIKVRDDTDRQTTYAGSLNKFDVSMLGKTITLPTIHGRWGQDFIAKSE